MALCGPGAPDCLSSKGTPPHYSLCDRAGGPWPLLYPPGVLPSSSCSRSNGRLLPCPPASPSSCLQARHLTVCPTHPSASRLCPRHSFSFLPRVPPVIAPAPLSALPLARHSSPTTLRPVGALPFPGHAVSSAWWAPAQP